MFGVRKNVTSAAKRYVAAKKTTRPAAPAPVYAGGYGGGGGGGGYAGSSAGFGPASASLGEDPAYLAFMRAATGEEADARGATQDRIDVLNRELRRQLPEIAQAGEYTREGISGNFESRGLLRAGAHEQALARQRAAEATQTGGITGMIADQRSVLEADLARRLADIKRRTAEASLTAARGVYR